jgi:hypothetical protein
MHANRDVGITYRSSENYEPVVFFDSSHGVRAAARTMHVCLTRRRRTPLALAYHSDRAWAPAPSSLYHATCPHGPACWDGGCPDRVYVPASCAHCACSSAAGCQRQAGARWATLQGNALKSYDSALLQAGLLLPCATANQSWVEPRATSSWKVCPLHSSLGTQNGTGTF